LLCEKKMQRQGGYVKKSVQKDRYRTVTFQVETMVPLPAGEQIFISGSADELGNWNATGFALSRTDDNLWKGSTTLPADQTVEYKITRGSWEAEEVFTDGQITGNYSLTPGRIEVMIHLVHHWKDLVLGPTPQIVGNYRFLENFKSAFLKQKRDIIIWLPPTYEEDPTRRYPVLYMQDGQQVFDPQTSTWGKAWNVDEACMHLIGQQQIEEFIVVAVYSTSDRDDEYQPAVEGRSYARFLIEELKPFIDEHYRTLPGAESTAVAGSSRGGTMAFYLAWAYPDIFSKAACLSPAFDVDNDSFIHDLVHKTKSTPVIRLFLYCGNGADLEKELFPGTTAMDKYLHRRKHFKDMKNLIFVKDPTALHNEAAWARHTEEWIRFLFGV